MRRAAAARCRAHEALQARTAEHLRASGWPLSDTVPIRAVVAHRSPWTRTAVGDALDRVGIRVVALLDDGADTLGAAVAEQPDVIFVQDRLPSLSGVELVTLLRRFVPQAVVAVHALHAGLVPELVAAGAQAAFTRRVTVEEVAAQTLSCLGGNVPACAVVSCWSDGRRQTWPRVAGSDLVPTRPATAEVGDQRAPALRVPVS